MAGQNSFGSSLLQAIANLAPGLSQSVRRQASGSDWEVFTPMQADAGNLAALINSQPGASYLLQASDRGRPIETTSASAVTVTLPNSLPVGFTATIYQAGAGQITLAAASGAVIRHRQNHTKTAGQWAAIAVLVRSNLGGGAAEYVIWGDTAA